MVTKVNEFLSTVRERSQSNPIWPPAVITDHDKKKIEKIQKHPDFFLDEYLGARLRWEGQDRVIEAVANNERVVVPSGHSLGKDYIAARLMLWFLYSFQPSIVIATSATARQINKIIWGELSEAFYGANKSFRGRFLTQEIIVDPKQKWYAIGFSTRDVRKAPGKFQGFHQKNVMLLFSEAQAIERSIWEQAESLMTAATARWIAIGNPIINYGGFIDAMKVGSGWKKVTLDCEDSPNVKEDRIVIPGLCTKSWVDGMAKKYGKDSPTYLSKVKGIPPPKSEGAFIDGSWVEWANTHGESVVPDQEGPLVVGADIAGGEEDYDDTSETEKKEPDNSVLTARKGFKVIAVDKYKKERPMEIAGKLVGWLNKGAIVYVDVTGIGAGVYSRLVELGFSDKVIPINFGGKPENREESEQVGTLKNTDIYADMGSYMYGRVAGLLEKKEMAFPYDEELSIGLTNRKMLTRSDGKSKLEPKKLYKKRGFGSPDEADSLVLCFCDAKGKGQIPKPFVQVEEEDPSLMEIFE